MLGFLGGTTVISLIGCLQRKSAADSSIQALAPKSSTCLVKPEQTEGPYFINERLNRADIRSDPLDGSIRQGVPLRLVFQVSQIRDKSCLPLSGAIVDVWHCDAEGIYSDVIDRSFNTVGKKFLRGYQVTDGNGTAEFITIYPGQYPGRAIHIHFKIRAISAFQQGQEFTSQLYFDDVLSDRVHAQAPYRKEEQRTLNREDGIFQRGGEQLTLQLTQAAEGYVGRFNIALEQS
ncbi:intradiol ring-cleavage dioxygenase [Dolichospermum sp. UHCC 0259]|uniref:intradiol ring-cleavage dioxygenase n=1 Tax=Dolichospermum sp. UHCC 0259 TaxID=2590010 RepID=UPI00352AB394